MKSIAQLEQKVENLTDQINDVFHATTLNLEALSVQLRPFSESNMIQSSLSQCQKQFENIQILFKERANLRLQYLITEQIKEEQAKVRRQRLVEYEQKIYDQRRLISDKETFYQALLKPRKKRPAHMTIQQFQAERRKEAIMQERKNIKRLEDETNELKQVEGYLRQDNKKLQAILSQLDKQDIPDHQLQNICRAIDTNPVIYNNINSMTQRKDDKEELTKLLQNIASLQQSNDSFHKQYLQERQLHQYLKWQHSKLKSEYMQKNEDRIDNEIKNRKKIEQLSRYKIKRSLSL